MDQVPKILKPLVDEWTREGYIVSFKVSNILPNQQPLTNTVNSSRLTIASSYPKLGLH